MCFKTKDEADRFAQALFPKLMNTLGPAKAAYVGSEVGGLAAFDAYDKGREGSLNMTQTMDDWRP